MLTVIAVAILLFSASSEKQGCTARVVRGANLVNLVKGSRILSVDGHNSRFEYFGSDGTYGRTGGSNPNLWATYKFESDSVCVTFDHSIECRRLEVCPNGLFRWRLSRDVAFSIMSIKH